MTKLFCSLFLMVMSVAAQTTAPSVVRQLRAPADANARVQVVKPDGTVALAIIGSGVELDLTGPIPVLKTIVVLPLLPQEIRLVFVAGAIPSQFYDLNHDNVPNAKVKVYKNGLLQMEGPQYDYQLIGRRVTFNAGSVPLSEVTAGDYIQIIYVI